MHNCEYFREVKLSLSRKQIHHSLVSLRMRVISIGDLSQLSMSSSIMFKNRDDNSKISALHLNYYVNNL